MTEVPSSVRHAVRAANLGRIERAEGAGAGNRNDVWIVDTPHRQVVVRLLADDARLRMESRLLDVASRAGLPVATCLWSSNEPRPVMIQTVLPGSRLADIQPPQALCEGLASLLRRIHAIPIEHGFGTLTAELAGTDHTLPGWFSTRVRNEASDVSTSPADGRMLDAALAALDGARELLACQAPGLVHGDIQPFNVLVKGKKVTGILDWEAAKSGPPGFDFGWWDWWSDAFHTPWTTDKLLDAYDPDEQLDRVELASIRELVQIRIWTRELVAAARHDQPERASSARAALEARL